MEETFFLNVMEKAHSFQSPPSSKLRLQQKNNAKGCMVFRQSYASSFSKERYNGCY
jgi:hypothetical protein